MSYSAAELAALAEKAARGAGAHAAQATHFGRAAVRHLAAGRDPTALTDALAALPGGPIQTLPFAAETSEPWVLAQSYAEAQAGGALPPRIACPPETLALLDRLARETYVPSSAASRLGGAGAGLTDSD